MYYKRYANKLTKIKKLSRKLYYENIISTSSHKSQTIWNCIRSAINKKNVNNNTTLSLTVDNTSIQDHTSIADTFDKYFTSVEKNLASNFHNSPYDKKPHEFLNNCVSSSMYLEPPVNTEIFDTIMSLNPKKSCGPDGISSIFVCAAASVMLQF